MKKKLLVVVATVIFILFFVTISNAALIDQTGNLLNNGSFESGNTDPVSGHDVWSAASYWGQWINDGSSLTSELITDSEMHTNFNTGVIDGDRAFRISTDGQWSGGYTFESFHNPGWDTYAELTFSAWVYTISGKAGLWNGSNDDGFKTTPSTTTGQWEFLSITIEGGRKNNEPLLYSVGGAANFIVDAAWLNYGPSIDNPSAPVPIPASILLFGTGVGVLAGTRIRRKK